MNKGSKVAATPLGGALLPSTSRATKIAEIGDLTVNQGVVLEYSYRILYHTSSLLNVVLCNVTCVNSQISCVHNNLVAKKTGSR